MLNLSLYFSTKKKKNFENKFYINAGLSFLKERMSFLCEYLNVYRGGSRILSRVGSKMKDFQLQLRCSFLAQEVTKV